MGFTNLYSFALTDFSVCHIIIIPNSYNPLSIIELLWLGNPLSPASDKSYFSYSGASWQIREVFDECSINQRSAKSEILPRKPTETMLIQTINCF